MRVPQILLVSALIISTGVTQAAKPKHSKSKPKVSKSRSAKPTGASHKVRKGETAFKIANAYGLEVSELASLNPKVKISKLSAGTILKVGPVPQKRVERATSSDLVESGIQEARREPVVPVPALPSIPAQTPATLLHLERVLPENMIKMAPGAVPNASSVPSSQGLVALLPGPMVSVGALGLEYESKMAADLGFQPVDPSQIDLLWPVETRTVSSAWGPRIRTRSVRVVKATSRKNKKVKVKYQSSHKGVDLTAPTGTDVYAAMDAKVVVAGKHRQYGNYVILEHGNGVQTLYAHLNAIHTQDGEIVHRGQKIGQVGRTGNATGPHLHFELIESGQRQNPLPFLNDVEEIPAEMMALNNLPPKINRRR